MSQSNPPTKRPYATHYFTLPYDRSPVFTQSGACKHEENAAERGMGHIWRRHYGRVRCIDRALDIVLWECWMGPDGLPRFCWGREMPQAMLNERQRGLIRRVK